MERDIAEGLRCNCRPASEMRPCFRTFTNAPKWLREKFLSSTPGMLRFKPPYCRPAWGAGHEGLPPAADSNTV